MSIPVPKVHLLRNWSICTWGITYWLPDQPLLLAPEFILQREDLPPLFPELRRYLKFWERSIEARIHSVRVASAALATPAEMRMVNTEMFLH